MELDGWDVCEEDIFNDEKNTGQDEMTMDNVGSSQGFDPNQRWGEEREYFARFLWCKD